MSDPRYYGNAIWTNHALQRLKERGLSQEMAWTAFQYPEGQKAGKQYGTMEYTKRFGNYLVTVIAKQNDKNEWIILSCWMDPPLPGTADAKKKIAYQKYRKAGFWGQFWMAIKKEVFGIEY